MNTDRRASGWGPSVLFHTGLAFASDIKRRSFFPDRQKVGHECNGESGKLCPVFFNSVIRAFRVEKLTSKIREKLCKSGTATDKNTIFSCAICTNIFHKIETGKEILEIGETLCYKVRESFRCVGMNCRKEFYMGLFDTIRAKYEQTEYFTIGPNSVIEEGHTASRFGEHDFIIYRRPTGQGEEIRVNTYYYDDNDRIKCCRNYDRKLCSSEVEYAALDRRFIENQACNAWIDGAR